MALLLTTFWSSVGHHAGSPLTLLPVGPVAAASAVGVGLVGVTLVWWLFGSSDDDADGPEALRPLAERLGTDADPTAITREVNELIDRLDSITRTVDLDRHAPHRIDHSSTALERAIALESALQTDQLAIRPPSGQQTGRGSGRQPRSGDGSVSEAAEAVEARLSPSAPVATDLLEVLSRGGSEGQTRAALREAVEYLEAYAALEQSLRNVDPAAPDVASRLRSETADRSGPVISNVLALANALEQCRERAETVESDRKQLAEAVETLSTAAEDEPHLEIASADGREGSTVERGRALASLARDGDLFRGESIVPQAAREVRQSVSPDSGTASELVDGLASPAQAGDLTETLATAVQLIDERATNRGAIGDIEMGAIRELLQQVESRVASLDGPIAAVIARRLDDLRGILDNADPANTIGPYAVKQELRFYERRLLDTMEAESRSQRAAGGAESDADLSDRFDAVAEQRSMIDTRYVDGRPDHNHSIPIHFLSLGDDLQSRAEELASREETSRAQGVLDGVEAVLDHVEQLYERNEYSVLLRRLRG